MDLAIFGNCRTRRVYYKMRVVDAIPRRAGLVEPAQAQPEAVAPRERSILFEARAVERFGLTNRLLGTRADEGERLGQAEQAGARRGRVLAQFFRLRQVRRVVAGAVELAHRYARERFAASCSHCALCRALQAFPPPQSSVHASMPSPRALDLTGKTEMAQNLRTARRRQLAACKTLANSRSGPIEARLDPRDAALAH